MESIAELILKSISDDYYGDNPFYGVSLRIKEMLGDNIFQKISNLQSGLESLEKNFGVKLVDKYDMPIYIDSKYELIEFSLDLTACQMDDDGDLIPLDNQK